MKSKIIMFIFCFVAFVTKALAQTATSINIHDTRAVNDLPNFFGHGIRADFKQIGTIGVPGQGYYGTNITIGQWDDWNNSGGKNHQLNFNDGGFFYRSAYPMDPQWGTWRQVLLTSENGNVGIGTNNPLSKLDVNGNINIAGAAGRRIFMGGAGGSTFGLAYDLTYPNYGIFYTEGEPDFVSISPNGNSQNGVMNVFGNGNVGIGTTNPRANLDMAKDISNGQLGTVFGRLPEGDGSGLGTYLGVKGYATQGVDFNNIKSFSIVHDFYGQTNSSINFLRGGGTLGGCITFSTFDNTEKMRIAGNGNVGIGTTTPEAKLDVNGSIQTGGGANNFYGFGESSASKPIDVRTGPQYPYVFNWHTGLTFSAHSTYGGIRFYNQGYPNMYGEGVMVMAITNNNVGIGTTTPDAKLAVKGQIHAQEVKVDLQGAMVPDYVFAKEYKLKSLAEVEAYIKTNSHLPEVPSAKEIEKNGLQLGEMNMVLLKKIEELTLHAIEQQKQIEFLKTENNTYKTLAERLTAIEKELTKETKQE